MTSQPTSPPPPEQQASPAELAAATAIIAGTTVAGLEVLGFPAILATKLRSDQAAIGDLTVRQVRLLFQSKFDPASARSSWAEVERLLGTLIEARRGASAQLSGRYYQQMRLASGNGTLPRLPGPAPVTPDHMEKIVRPAGLGSFLHEVKQGAPPQQAASTAVQSVSRASATAVLGGGRTAITNAVQQDAQASGWMRLARPGACPFCTLLAGRVYPRDNAGFPAHNSCVAGSTIVDGPSVEVAYRRWYEGEVIILCVAGGKELTITPNHPVLTPRGWVAAGLLSEGDYVIQGAVADWAPVLDSPGKHDMPARIEDVWRANLVSGLSYSAPVAAEDFHGDGQPANGDVNVVRADSHLRNAVVAAMPDLVGYPLLPDSYAPRLASGLPALGPQPVFFDGVNPSSDGVVGGPGALASLLGGCLGHHDPAGIALAAQLYAGFEEAFLDDWPGYAEALGEVEFEHAGLVESYDLLVRQVSPVGVRLDATLTQPSPENALADASHGADLLARLAGNIHVERIAELRRVGFAGHVYNLQTAEGWYTASHTITRNCRCFAVPVFGLKVTPVGPAAYKRKGSVQGEFAAG
jgi:hypothetical protein